MKVNVDGCAQLNLRNAADGGLIRNPDGLCLGAFLYRVGNDTALISELCAIFQGLTLSWNSGYRHVQVETDSLSAYTKITGPVTGQESHSSLLSAIQGLLTMDWCSSIHHIYRQANSCADCLASHALSYDLGLHLLTTPPDGLK